MRIIDYAGLNYAATSRGVFVERSTAKRSVLNPAQCGQRQPAVSQARFGVRRRNAFIMGEYTSRISHRLGPYAKINLSMFSAWIRAFALVASYEIGMFSKSAWV